MLCVSMLLPLLCDAWQMHSTKCIHSLTTFLFLQLSMSLFTPSYVTYTHSSWNNKKWVITSTIHSSLVFIIIFFLSYNIDILTKEKTGEYVFHSLFCFCCCLPMGESVDLKNTSSLCFQERHEVSDCSVPN